MNRMLIGSMTGFMALAQAGTIVRGDVVYTESFELGTPGVAGNADNWGWEVQKPDAAFNTESPFHSDGLQSISFTFPSNAVGRQALKDMKGTWAVATPDRKVTASIDVVNYSAGQGHVVTWDMTLGVVYTDDTTGTLTYAPYDNASVYLDGFVSSTNTWITAKPVKAITSVVVGLTDNRVRTYTLTWGFDNLRIEVNAPLRYVARGGQTPSAGYASWTTAASNIQDAVDAALPGETVLVSNGVYDIGWRTNYPAGGLLPNRVVIDKAITVRSLNDNPASTIIKGAWDATTTNGPGAVRCVYMSAGTLIGITVTNGATFASGIASDQHGGGVHVPVSHAPVISNCVIVGNAAKNSGGGAHYGYLKACLVSRNVAGTTGGGAFYSKMTNCTIAGNAVTAASGSTGGGARLVTMYDCTVVGNTSACDGGGVADCTADNCTIIGNSALNYRGGGVYYGTLNRCTIASNSAQYAGGSWFGNLVNCLIISNHAQYAAGAYHGTLNNCTVANNSNYGVWYGTLNNCIVYFNAIANHLASPTFAYSCTTPAPGGTGNTTLDPKFLDAGAGNYRLQARSPCRNTGINGSWTTTYPLDLDGRARILDGQVEMGAYETFVPKGTVIGLR